MSKYKQTEVAGESYVRAMNTNIDHRLDQVPIVTFQEEKIVTLGNDVIHQYQGNLRVTVDNFDAEFPLVNPATGEDTGVMATAADVYAMLHSYYMFKATQRDTPQVAEEVVAEEVGGQ